MMEFDWDEEKAEANIKKHGVSFEVAIYIWLGPVVEREDNRFDYGEERLIAFGEVDGRVLAVVYTWRGDVCRIISARRANRHERTAYRQAIAGAEDNGS
jgi:hypothetical protein